MTNKTDVKVLENYYNKGDFFSTRKQAKNLIANESTDSSLRKKAKEYLHMTGVDKLAILAGLGTLTFVIVITIMTKLIGH